MAKTYVISGGNSGIGLEAGRQLARDGHKVILLGRDPKKGEAAVASIGSNAEFIASDLSTHAGTRDCATRIAGSNPVIDGLILGAGVLTTSGDLRTSDGLHAIFSTNYLSRYHLTQRLLPNLKASASPTVVLLVAGVSVESRINTAHFTPNAPWPGMSGLSGVQIANYHYVKHLAAKEPAVKCAVCNVGLVKTEIMRAMPAVMRFGFAVFGPLITIPVEKAAENPVWLSTHSEWKSGTYFPKPGHRDTTINLDAALPNETEQVVKLSSELTQA
ncbi:MAG: SDR family NAD(P)-dependent oxidoreductase [Myxococcaceae bacterium]